MSTDRLQPHESIARIESTMLGYEDHGILTAMLYLDYGGSGQGAGGYGLDEYDKETEQRVVGPECGRWIVGVLAAVGVSKWEDVKGKTIIAIKDEPDWGGKVIGIRPLPTNKGKAFMFADAFDRERVPA